MLDAWSWLVRPSAQRRSHPDANLVLLANELPGNRTDHVRSRARPPPVTEDAGR